MLGTKQRKAYRSFQAMVLSAVISPLMFSSTWAAKPVSRETVQSRLSEQSQKLGSLCLRARRTTTLHVDSKVFRTWPPLPELPKYFGTDEVLIAFKAERRYLRVLELDYGRQSSSESLSKGHQGRRQYLDEAAVWTGNVLRERVKNPQTGGYEYRTGLQGKTQDRFPPAFSLNLGLAVSDPTASDPVRRNPGQSWLLAANLQHAVILEKTEKIDGRTCVVLEAKGQWQPSEGATSLRKSIAHRIWLDAEHGLALCKWEKRIDGQLTRVANSEIAELLPGIWLPTQSRREIFAPTDAPKQYQDRPIITEETTICLRVANQVPDDFFDLALTKPRPWRVSERELPPAYHSRESRSYSRGESVEEVWEIRHVGRRVEVRKGSQLVRLIVDTPRWHFVWDPARSRVMASPSRLETPQEQGEWSHDRAYIVSDAETLLGVPACQKDRLGDKEVDKVTIYYPADPQQQGNWPIHDFDPEVQRAARPTEPRTRTYWFDAKTQRMVKRQCGCQPPKYTVTVEYPDAESLSRDLFSFQIPPMARLEVADPELGRPLESEGQKKLE